MTAQAPAVSIVLRYFTVGGLERVVIALANAFAARGVDTRVIVLSTGKRNALITELDAGVDVALLSGERQEKLAALRKLTHGRLVHIHFGDGHIHPLIRTALVDRKVVITYHSVYRHKRTWLKNRLDQFWASRATGIIAVSNAVKEFCAGDVRIPADRITVIPNGIESRVGPAIARPAGGPLTAISLASLYPHKNHGVLLDGLSIARQKGIDLRLRMLGDGPSMAAHYRRCLTLGLRPAVDWYGAVWRRDMVQPLLASSDLFVSGSRFEGLPLSVLEGMAHGLPMVLSDIPPHREVAGDAALYFPPDDPAALADRIHAITASAERRAEMQEASRRRVKTFDLDRCVEDHLAVYRQAAAR
ncbi:Glycosyltransferase [Minicystis rosea]|nr:Glycosyltransferase [Minicystis rosea]